MIYLIWIPRHFLKLQPGYLLNFELCDIYGGFLEVVVGVLVGQLDWFVGFLDRVRGTQGIRRRMWEGKLRVVVGASYS